MDNHTASQAAHLLPIIHRYRKQIDSGQPWIGDSPLDDETLQFVAKGVANTYPARTLAADIYWADESHTVVTNLIATVFALGFNTAATHLSNLSGR